MTASIRLPLSQALACMEHVKEASFCFWLSKTFQGCKNMPRRFVIVKRFRWSLNGKTVATCCIFSIQSCAVVSVPAVWSYPGNLSRNAFHRTYRSVRPYSTHRSARQRKRTNKKSHKQDPTLILTAIETEQSFSYSSETSALAMVPASIL